MKKIKNMPKWLIIVIAILLIGMVGTVLSDNDADTNNSSNKTTNKIEKEKETTYKVNEPFVFDDLQITIGSEVSYDKVNNQYSEQHGKTVVKVPITIKNKKDESHYLNMFYIKVFGTKGTELDDISAYFDDKGAIQFAGELMPEASYTKYLFFLYDGDGTYTIQFDNYAKKINFKLDIKK